MAHYISYSLFDSPLLLLILELIRAPPHTDNRSNSRANTCINSQLLRWDGMYLLDGNQCGQAGIVVSHNNFADRMALPGDGSFKFLPYQLWMVGYWPTMALTGNGELGFDSGEGA